jgi:hypothetical protein
MLSQKPNLLFFGENGHIGPLGNATLAGADYTPHDLTVTVTALPSSGIVLKGDTQVSLGQTMTAADLAALKFAPAATSFVSAAGNEIAPAGYGPVMYVAQNCEPAQIPVDALFDSSVVNSYVTITEIPSNGTVLLSDGTTCVSQGQILQVAQLNGLMFRPAPDACGKLSLLQCRTLGAGGTSVVGSVLLAVGPDAPSFRGPPIARETENNTLAPFAVALLLDTALSSSNTAVASLTDVLPTAATPVRDAVSAAVPLFERGFAQPFDVLALAPASGEKGSTGSEATQVDLPQLKHIGSGSSPVPATPASTSVLTGTALPSTGVVLSTPGPLASTSAPLSVTNTSPVTIPQVAAPQVAALQITPAPNFSQPNISAPNIGVQSFALAAATPAAQAAAPNLITLENEKPGTPQSVWQIDPGQDSTLIQGFTTEISTNVGGTVSFKIDNLTGTPNYHINIYRLGYYGGDGATLEATVQHTASTSVIQPAPLTDPSTGIVDAGNWSVTDSWTLPSSAISGVYVANVIDGSQIFQIPFVVRDDSSTSDIVFQTDDETWQAYNGWGGADVYGGNGPGPDGASYGVSYNRPITTRDGSSGGESGTSNDMVFSAEYPAIYWLEENGYDVSYISGIDAATNGSLLLNHKVYMDVGHDEYWTDSQRANVQAAADAGVNLMFLSGNEIYWQTRLAPSMDSTADANRTLITYKDTHANAVIDPTGTATGTYMDARFASSGGMSGIPSNSLTGTVFQVDSDRTDTLTIPYDMTQLRFWRNTSVADTAPGQTASLVQNLLGYEWDSSPDNGFRPTGLVDLSSTTLQVSTDLLDYGNTVGNGTATHNLVEYRDPVSGALVFGAGTVFWSWGLSSDHDQVTGAPTPTDPNVQQAMVNLFADMGVQPTTLQASLVIATQSTDHTPPKSTITHLSATSVVEGRSITVNGTASDVGGVIGGVEVSTDGGNTWHPAVSAVGTPSVTWTYTFTAGASGTTTIESRAVDDSLNLETPGPGAALLVTPSSNLTIFNPTDTPALVTNNDPNPVELGVKFVSAVSGEITGIRFYKGAQNTGTHLGDLWTSDGTLLASATFTNETASGWQQVNFATPVRIQSGVTYIASYHTDAGEYSTTDFFFDNTGTTNGALTATGSGLNGVYAYGSGPLFPSNVSIVKGDNYWVDVVFNDTSLQPQANNDSGFSVTENGTLTIAASALLANDTDPSGLPFSITSVSSPVNGTVAYNAQSQTITFVPNSGYAGAANFTYTITDTGGTSGSGQVSLDVNYPVSAQSMFGTNDTPSVINSGDSGSVELGVKFTASADGLITGIRFYKGPSNTGPHVADLWSSTGTLLATATFTSESASGWQEVDFSTPVAITAGTTYVAAYHTSGNYSASANYFTNSLTNGELTAPSGNDGVYAYGSGNVFPTNTYKSTNYWVDVVFDGSNRPVANADSGFIVNENGSITIAASALLANDTDSGGFAMSVTGVSNPSNGTVSYDANAQTVTFVPTSGYNGTANFTYTVGDTNGGTASASVALFVNDPSAENLFSLSSVPSTVTVNDASPVELGVKFTADASGLITGLRFYKGPQNTGPHVADLWSSTGTLLATATFTNETASGWQQVNFSNPVAITAGVTYVASYHTSGDYSADSNYFANSLVSGDLTAAANGNGVYAYGSQSIFPTGTYGASNYWVDVVYTRTALSPVANNDSGFVVGDNGSITIAASALLANDTDPNGLPLSITGVSNPTNGAVSYDPGTQAVTFVPTAGYTGPASFSYIISDGQAPSASATVSLTVSLPPPVANNDGSFVVNEDGSITIAASALLANDTDPSGLPLSITAVGSAVNGTVSYDASAQAVTFVPTAGYSGAASFGYSVGDANGGSASANVSLFVNPTSTESLFNPDAVPTLVTVNDPSSVELGVKFTADANGLITGLRFYKGPQNTGPHVADLWSSDGTLLATASFSTETASGWQQVNFSSPVSITAGTTYVASYHTNGDYSADSGYFNSSLVSGDLTAPAGGNGVYAYGSASIFPTNTYGASNYWVDVVYSKPLQPPVANNDSGFVATENGSVTIAASALLANDTDPNGLPLSITGVGNSTNGTASYNANTQSVTFVPNAGYAGSASFTYSVSDSGGGTASASASLIVNDPSTTSLFSPTSTPAITTVNDPTPIELGVKFQAATDGDITGLLFYKGPANTGPHVADLWSSTGTLLATATFTNETASGWQQVNFAAPVAITAGTTYVASYHANGDYSADPNLFAAAQTNGSLTAPSSSSSGGNGVYAYGGAGLFPTNSFNSTSYGVDVVFKAQLAA